MQKEELAAWRELYEAAIAYKKLAPWEWLDDLAIFAVEEPGSGETGYCTVMGGAGMEFGLAAFLGDAGFTTYARLIVDDGGPEPDPMESMLTLRSLALTFADRQHLEREDVAIIRELGLRFRGAGAWPMFRSQIPGHWPWFLDAEEAAFLSMTLRQAVRVAEAARAGTVKLHEWPSTGEIVTATYAGDEPSIVMRELPPPLEEEEAAELDDLQVHRLRRPKDASELPWEVDIFMLPATIQKNRRERPSYPVVALAVDGSGFIAGVEMLEGTSSAREVQDALVRILENAPAQPSAFHVSRLRPAEALANIATATGIPLYEVEETATLDAAKMSLIGDFGQYG